MAHTTAVEFFFQHAGFSYDPKTETEEQGKQRCAEMMARAEAYANEHEWMYTWEGDIDLDDSFVRSWDEAEQAKWDTTEHECLACVLCNSEGSVLASCGGIWDADSDYARVMEAELACEALGEIEREERNATECAALEVL